ncbi:hypothetical protein ACKWCC_05495 [Maribacter sp. 2307ULW6-5]
MMNRTLSLILLVLALGLIVYNVTLINFSNPLEGNSIIAIIGVVASLCAIVLILIYNASKKVEKKLEGED